MNESEPDFDSESDLPELIYSESEFDSGNLNVLENPIFEEIRNNTLSPLENLILQRNLFEIHVYDYLVNPYVLVPDDFWDPIKVGLKPHEMLHLNEVIVHDNCVICTDNSDLFREVNCCKNKICNSCTERWFSESVRCPFCAQDLRDFI